ncbi:hypothetical protein CKA32_003440 [Geitlerinema sp. FC II]|nr:hypothetical protein CKA32_003440 [Geitlerinema sp. FC II]
MTSEGQSKGTEADTRIVRLHHEPQRLDRSLTERPNGLGIPRYSRQV